nr:MAG: hypothetical protein [Bacteriophage sp.]
MNTLLKSTSVLYDSLRTLCAKAFIASPLVSDWRIYFVQYIPAAAVDPPIIFLAVSTLFNALATYSTFSAELKAFAISSAVNTAPNPGIFLVRNFTAAFVANAPPALVAIIPAKLAASLYDVPISGIE